MSYIRNISLQGNYIFKQNKNRLYLKVFKGLDLIDRVTDELWMEVLDIVWETGIKTIPMEKMQKSKMAVWGGLTNSCKKKTREKQRRKGKI